MNVMVNILMFIIMVIFLMMRNVKIGVLKLFVLFWVRIFFGLDFILLWNILLMMRLIVFSIRNSIIKIIVYRFICNFGKDFVWSKDNLLNSNII